MPHQTYQTYSRYKWDAGDQLLTEDNERFGFLTIVDRAEVGGIHGLISRGYYILQCDCGSPAFEMHVRAITHGLMQRSNKVFSCGCKMQRRKKASKSRAPANHSGKTIGRIVVGEWIPEKGWECHCTECAEVLMVRTSAGLGAEGLRPCGNPCGEQ